ncbi:MAG: hypothetical protein IH851_04210 [Armatimonadetes bacterium]|nr:hypothetical protein [Armatimonadota bacterium]
MTEKPERRYTEKEVSAILRRALDQQHADNELQQAEDALDGVTLDKLVGIAAEVGIPPEDVRAAAKCVDQSGLSPGAFHIWGCPANFDVERLLEGEVSEEQWGDVVDEIRKSLGAAGGEADRVGNSFEWKRGTDVTKTHVSFAPRSGRTKARLAMQITDLIFVTYFSALICSLFLGGAFVVLMAKNGFSVPALLGVATVGTVGLLFFLRSRLHNWYLDRRRRFLALVDSVQGVLLSGKSQTEVAAASAATDARIAKELSPPVQLTEYDQTADETADKVEKTEEDIRLRLSDQS